MDNRNTRVRLGVTRQWGRQCFNITRRARLPRGVMVVFCVGVQVHVARVCVLFQLVRVVCVCPMSIEFVQHDRGLALFFSMSGGISVAPERSGEVA